MRDVKRIIGTCFSAGALLLPAGGGTPPPVPPGPEAWTFRRELAEDPPPAFDAPAWAVVRQGHDYNNGGTVWARPDVPMFPEPRLHQHALTGDNFARIVYPQEKKEE